VEEYRVEYLNSIANREKQELTMKIVQEISSLNPPGRFIMQDMNSKLWYDIGDNKARFKTSQELREKAPMIMKELKDNNVSTFCHKKNSTSPHLLPNVTNKPFMFDNALQRESSHVKISSEVCFICINDRVQSFNDLDECEYFFIRFSRKLCVSITRLP